MKVSCLKVNFSPQKNHFALFLAALVLLCITLLGRHYIPPDETRYLSVAWDMWLDHDYLVPHLNHAPYSHKPPLLFWLINIGWFLFGPSDWWPRLIPFLFSVGSMVLTKKIADAFWPQNKRIGDIAVTLLLSNVVWGIYTSALMFDMMLTFFSMLGIYGMVKTIKEKNAYGFIWIVISFAGGLLAKGPTIILQLLPLALTAPWWTDHHRMPWKKWYSYFVLSLFLGVLILMAWAIPAGIAGGEKYQHDIFWGQTASRVVNSFAHNRPFLWYLEISPLILFPWFFVPKFWTALLQKSAFKKSEGFKFCLFWFVPILVSFSVISGKQVHYLLPIYPALALMIASQLEGIKLMRWYDHLCSVLPVMVIGGVIIYFSVTHRWDHMSPWIQSLPHTNGWILLLGGFAIFFIQGRTPIHFLWKLILINILLTSVIFLGIIHHTDKAYDLRDISAKIKTIEDKKLPVAFLGNYAGQFDFIGRLLHAPQSITSPTLMDWTNQHPEGYVIIVFDGKPNFSSFESEYHSMYRGSYIAIFSSSQANHFCKSDPGTLSPCVEH